MRTPHRNNWDFVADKDAPAWAADARRSSSFEVLNLTNTVEGARSRSRTVGSSTFGQIRTQSGFMRLTQMMFRLSF